MEIRLVAAFVVALFSAQIAAGARFLIVTKPAAGTWAVFDAEDVGINGSGKVRTLVAGAPVPGTFDGKALGRLAAVTLERCQIVRRTSDGTWLAQVGAAPQWQILLPDGLKLKTASAPAELWKSSGMAVRKSRKDKSEEAVPVDTVLALPPGSARHQT